MAFAKLGRLRKNKAVRELLSQTEIAGKDLIMPYFVIEGGNKKEAIKSLPGIYRLSIDNLVKEVKEIKDSGIKAILLFGICRKKDARGSKAYRQNGLVQRAIKAIRQEVKEMVVITDVCLCGYTLRGHCGIIIKSQIPNIDNDATLKALAKIAVSHAQSGADLVAPSAMADGQVKIIREALDRNGFQGVGILAYSAKYASNFYGPFREALDSSPEFGDRKGYQLDYRNGDEALREITQDIEEGADIIMVKPALAYLDIVSKAKQRFNVPLAAYNVSGEYALVKSAVKAGIVDERNIILEILTSIKRAGADLIITYHAKEVARWLRP